MPAYSIDTITTANMHLLLPIAQNMREGDKAEVRAFCGLDPWAGIVRAANNSLGGHGKAFLVKAEIHGEMLPIMAYGVCQASCLSNTGNPWMLASHEWDRLMQGGLSRRFLRLCRGHAQALGRGFARLENAVAKSNAAAIRWLEWMGFTVEKGREIFYWDLSVPFYLFHKQT